MNRVIKFRVRDRETKAFIGYEMLMPDITNDAWKWACSYGGVDWQSGIYDGAYHLREQFTGLLDRNGKEVFEGDIIRAECEPNGQKHDQVVEYKDCGYWFTEDFGMDYYPPLKDDDIEIEVLGNIYENPELL
jgi:uncharacterized phage protein (TIGR01671 family)